MKKGRMKWEEWLPDGLHPQYRGSLSYAQSVISYLEKELETSDVCGKRPCKGLPAPLDPNNWEKAYTLPFSVVKLEGPCKIRRWPHSIWMEYVLDTSAVGAGLSFEFTGRGLSLGFDFGKTSAEFKYRLDDGEWVPVSRERPSWCGPQGWFRVSNIADDLQNCMHKFQLEVIHGDAPDCNGTNFTLAFIGVIP